MEQEQILSTLNEQLGQTSLSARTISDYVAANIPSEGEEFNFEKHVGILKSLNGNFSKSVADTVKQQVEDFKKNYKPQPADPPKPQPQPADDSALKRIQDLEDRLNESERKNLIHSLRASVSSKKDELNVRNPNLWNDCVAQVEISKDETDATLTDKTKKLYEKKLREYFGEGATPYGGGGGQNTVVASEDAKKAREALKKRMKAQGRL